jgi:hypothetical protein
MILQQFTAEFAGLASPLAMLEASARGAWVSVFLTGSKNFAA